VTPSGEHEGTAAVLEADNVDTDVIIPLADLVSIPRDRLGEACFKPWRCQSDGTLDPSFSLNHPDRRGASILIGRSNFGCGSSREGAVHALVGLGFKSIIAESFGDIFRSNCAKNGVIAATVASSDRLALAELCHQHPDLAVHVDAHARLITAGELAVSFQLSDGERSVLLDGGDEISRTMQLADLIRAFATERERTHPWSRPRSAEA
jgi:3-isopropylmalate/(R)-2-methylmalate dehydratase small subunit